MHFLVTGVAGFIGHRIALTLLEAGHQVSGIDNLNDYYVVALKQARLERLKPFPAFGFEPLDIADHERLLALPQRGEIDRVIHLAAQAGVRHSLKAPFSYASANLTGHLSVLEFCRHAPRQPLLVYASSSSVYGNSTRVPYREADSLDPPESLYAATKRADELMSLSYARLYGLRQVGIRFFTVYGPWGRPDMAYWSFTDRILRGLPVSVFNEGRMRRDFTYIDDAVAGLAAIAQGDPRFETADCPHRIYNIGNNRPVELLDFIAEIERATGCTAKLSMMPMQPGDVVETCADISAIGADFGFAPTTSLRDGIAAFVEWYRTVWLPGGAGLLAHGH